MGRAIVRVQLIPAKGGRARGEPMHGVKAGHVVHACWLTIHMPGDRFILSIPKHDAAEHGMPVIRATTDHRSIATAP